MCVISLSDSSSMKLFALRIRQSFPVFLSKTNYPYLGFSICYLGVKVISAFHPFFIGLTPATSPWRVALSASVALLRVSDSLGFVAMS